MTLISFSFIFLISDRRAQPKLLLIVLPFNLRTIGVINFLHGANGLIVTAPCGSNSSADSEMTLIRELFLNNICHKIFTTGFVRALFPEFSTHKVRSRLPSSHSVMHEVRFIQLKIQLN